MENGGFFDLIPWFFYKTEEMLNRRRFEYFLNLFLVGPRGKLEVMSRGNYVSMQKALLELSQPFQRVIPPDIGHTVGMAEVVGVDSLFPDHSYPCMFTRAPNNLESPLPRNGKNAHFGRGVFAELHELVHEPGGDYDSAFWRWSRWHATQFFWPTF